jgi:two-component system sensor histidine kinase TctE
MRDGAFVGGDRDLAAPDAAANPDIVSRDIRFRGKVLRAISVPYSHDTAQFDVTVAETTHKRQTAAWTAFAQMVIPTTLVLSLAFLIVWFSVRSALRPLGLLQSEIESRSELELSPIDVIGAPLEVHSLMRALNSLLKRLAAETQMHQAFVAEAAHQLRTPLAGIQMQADLIALTCRPEDERLVGQLRLSVSRTIRLANQLLSLARTEKDATALSLRRFDVAELVGEATDDWVHRAIAAQIDLGFELQPATIVGDRYLLRELLENLVDNALRYTPERGAITVSTRVVNDAVEVVVEDGGPGVPAELRERIFQRFFRESERADTGSGLGLAIVRQIAERHGGRAIASGDTVLGGLRVTVRLPTCGPGQAARPIDDPSAQQAECPALHSST